MVYCTGLENRRTETFRGFESRPLRHWLWMNFLGSWKVVFAQNQNKSQHTPLVVLLRFIVFTREGASSQFADLRERRRVGPSRFFAKKGPGDLSCWSDDSIVTLSKRALKLISYHHSSSSNLIRSATESGFGAI